MKVWVTGAGGQVGHALMQALEKKGIDHIGTTHAEADIGDIDRLRSFLSGVTHIINAAAYALVDPAETNRDAAFRANAAGPENLARLAREKGIRLIHISTDYVFDGTSKRPYREEDETNPLNWYAITKKEGETRVLRELPNACVVRVSWVFGGKGRNYANLVFDLLRQRKELKFVVDQIGRPTYVSDFAEVLIALLDQSGIYHFANEGMLSKYDFTCAIWEWAKQKKIPMACERIIPIPSSEFPTPAARPLYTPLDTAKIEKLIEIRPWTETLAEYMCKTFS